LHGRLHLWCSCFHIFEAQLCWVDTLLPSKESWPFWLHCRYRGQNFLERFCVLSFIFNLRIRKKHKDYIIRKYYYLFSFGHLLAIYFFIINILEFSIKKTNGILKLETQWFTFFLCVGKLDMLWLFFIRIFSFTSYMECLQLLIYKQTNKGALEIYYA